MKKFKVLRRQFAVAFVDAEDWYQAYDRAVELPDYEWDLCDDEYDVDEEVEP